MKIPFPTISILFTVSVQLLAGAVALTKPPDSFDLTQAVLVMTEKTSTHIKAIELLQQEIFKRTAIELALSENLPPTTVPAIIIGTVSTIELPDSIPVPEKAESYRIWLDSSTRKSPSVCLVGRDPRGMLFAAGRLLRLLSMRTGRLSLMQDVQITESPQYPHRCHELGYRALSNTYDAWDINQYEQYIRDLIVFGTNGFQLIPSLDPDRIDKPHMRSSIWDMTIKLAEIINDFGLDVWLYLPLLEDISQAEIAAETLSKRKALFENCPSIRAIFVPGGDPGNTPPDLLLPWLEKLGHTLRDSHPDAELWLSNEDFKSEWNTVLFEYLQQQQPEWLSGIIYGTWTRLTLQEQRSRIPQKYPIIQYADITHCIECQYPVADWDPAFAFTLGREPINPRPRAMAHIHNLQAPLTIGFTVYSDGVNDDVNKIIWSALAWNPESDIRTILREYGRYFIGEDFADDFCEALLALEENWEGPLLENESVETTLKHWQTLENHSSKTALKNWRFQIGLFRACYDAYIRRRLIRETDLEQRALNELKNASRAGVAPAIEAARCILAESDKHVIAQELRERILELGDALFQSIGMQMSVKKHGAMNWERGAVLDFLDQPLNNRHWLEAQFESILSEVDDKSIRLKHLDAILNWAHPGNGGFYDDLGNSQKQPHLIRQKSWADDPGYVESPQSEFIEIEGRTTWRRSWVTQGQTLYGTPLKMRYSALDPQGKYRLKVVYTGRFKPKVKLMANAIHQIHGPLPQPHQPQCLEFSIPDAATKTGSLELEWQLLEGRGIQVAEVWLIQDRNF
ncbi:hypothetical protein JXJ21_16695 [candidate division KSB1 bacterium]|nr:hypothetical protein [candidate division KSB1 bacterium]